jgi:uncharacterized cupin superfamily protein
MNKVNTTTMTPEERVSPKGRFALKRRHVSLALGRDDASTDLLKRHPFDVEIQAIPPGKTAFPYHGHSAQWEFYLVVSGRGTARDEHGVTRIEAGDAFVFKPGEAHQLANDGDADLVYYVIADNPLGESVHYPDSNKWMVRSPERRLMRPGGDDYYEGEE